MYIASTEEILKRMEKVHKAGVETECTGYVREPSGTLTLTALRCSYHTVSHTALHMDLSPTYGEISLNTELREIRVHSHNPVWLRNYFYRTVVSKASSPPCYLVTFLKTRRGLGHSYNLLLDTNLKISFYLNG